MKKIIILSALLLSLLPGQVQAQLTKQQAQEKYETLNHLWKQNKISTDTFLSRARILSINLLQHPVFHPDEFRNQLNAFREAAWSSDKYQKYRGVYFELLMNNAEMSGKSGEAIFYAIKSAEITKGNRKSPQKSLTLVYMKTAFYVQNGNYAKAIEEYTNITPLLDSLVRYPYQKENQRAPLINALQLSGVAVHAYVEEKQITEAYRLAERAELLYTQINQDTTFSVAFARALTNFIHIEIALAKQDYKTAYTFLRSCDSITTRKGWQQFPLSASITANLTEWWLKYYLAVKDYSNATHYLKLFSEGPSLYPNYPSFILEKKAELSTLKHDYKEAYLFMKKALVSKNENLLTLTNEMNHLLYAHAESEFNKSLLVSAKKAKEKRTRLSVAIGLGLMVIILILIFMNQRAKKNAAKRIENLNTLANFQITKAREEAAKKEQNRLARDLHDSYSAFIAGISNRLESVTQEATGTPWGKELEELSQYIEVLYESVRDKSHHLFWNSQNNQSIQLEKSILKMMEIALPARKFRKEIDIETAAVSTLSLAHQIEILRIVQEGIANIVKHGKNVDEVFLFIFKENDGVTLQIGDNGKKTKAYSSKKDNQTLGMESIRKRVASMKGQFNVSNDYGFTLTITLPNSL